MNRLILTLALVLASLSAWAEYPIIGANYRDTGSSTNLTSPTFHVSINTNDFSYLGTPVQTNDPGFCGFNFGDGENDVICQQPFIGSMCVDVEFNWTGQEFEIRGFAHDGTISISDGINTTNYIPLWDDGAAHRLFVKYPESATRKMRIYMDCTGAGTNLFSGVYLNAGDTISRIITPSKTMVVLADSYGTGYTAFDNVTPWSESYPLLAINAVTNTHAIPSGLTGTGIWNNGPNAGETNYINRFNVNVESNNPNWTVIQVSLNDENYNVTNIAGYYNLCTTLFNLAEAKYPGHVAILGALNPYTPFGFTDPNETLLNSNSLKAAQSSGVPYFDALTASVINNFSTDIGPDGVHPTPVGYLKIADFLNTKMQGTFADYPGSQVPYTTNIFVTDFGANPNVQSYWVKGVSNTPSFSIVSTNGTTSSGVYTGEVYMAYGAGPNINQSNDPPWMTISYFGHMPNTPQVVDTSDIVGIITNIVNGTNIYGTIPLYRNSVMYCVIGTNNRTAFQSCINSASNLVVNFGYTNVIVNIPLGTYLLASPKVLDPNFIITGQNVGDTNLQLSCGGITFNGMGASPTNTVLLDAGAGMVHDFNDGGDAYSSAPSGGFGYFYPMRDILFFEVGHFVSQYQITWNNLTLDGGVTNGAQTRNTFPLSTNSGAGWDEAHHAIAVLDPTFPAVIPTNQYIVNCVFQHYRGEVLASFTGQTTNEFKYFLNDIFQDNNVTADNMYGGQMISNCIFNACGKVAEFYQDNSFLPFTFINNLVTNSSELAGPAALTSCLAFTGATTERTMPSITVSNNLFYDDVGMVMLLLNAAENVTIRSNIFNVNFGLEFTGTGQQPQPPFGSPANYMTNVWIADNNGVTISGGFSFLGSWVMSNNVNFAFNSTGVGFVTNSICIGNSATFGPFGGPFGWSYPLMAGPYKYDIFNGQYFGSISNSIQGGQFILDVSNRWTLNNQDFIDDGGYNFTNTVISYGNGILHVIRQAGAKIYLDDFWSNQIPPNAQLQVNVGTFDGRPTTNFYTSLIGGVNGSVAKTSLSNGFSYFFTWNGTKWVVPGPLAVTNSLPLFPYLLH